MPRAYSYSRFSSPEQSKGNSLVRQKDKAAAYAKAHGLELDTSVNYSTFAVANFAVTL